MSCVLGKTTVIVRTTNLLNLSKPKGKIKRKGKRGRDEKDRSEREGRLGEGRVGEENKESESVV